MMGVLIRRGNTATGTLGRGQVSMDTEIGTLQLLAKEG